MDVFLALKAPRYIQWRIVKLITGNYGDAIFESKSELRHEFQCEQPIAYNSDGTEYRSMNNLFLGGRCVGHLK